MANNHSPVKPSKKDIEASQKLWENFTAYSKYSIIGTVVILILMAIFLV